MRKRPVSSPSNIRLLLSIVSSAAVVLTLACSAATAAPPKIALQRLVGGLSSPIDLQTPKDGTNRLFAVEQGGKIRIIQNGTILSPAFLDVTSIIESGGEEGLLGLAFHPSYAQNGRFFINYTQRVGGQLQSVIAEYHVSASDPNKADPAGTVLLTLDQPFDNHNGGQLAFGPDNFLYLGFGDGGSGGDPFGNGQNLGTLLGKILRIDIDSGSPYVIPPDNPFVGNPNAKGEIWAYGFRNPWRFSFDRRTGSLMVGDVGQDAWEEVDIVKKGLNYGWNIMEGFHCYPPGSNCNMTGLTLPIAEYSHSEGEATIGGYVYRGTKITGLSGIYVFGDYISGKMWALKNTAGTWKRAQLLSTGKFISAFGQDANGELYVLDYGAGVVYRIVAG